MAVDCVTRSSLEVKNELSSPPEELPYQETKRFLTWRKHTRNLYQQLFFVDLVWESPTVQLMPYISVKESTATHTILCGTRTGGQEQNFVQMLSATVPTAASTLDRSIMNDITREVGGYGYAPHLCGLKVERRMLHNGDVLAARYMPANPLLIGTCSSDGNSYLFDWSRVSLNKYPNDPPRPRAPLPPNELTELSTEEERLTYHKRMRALNAATLEQERWDLRTGPGQHTLTLKGNKGVPYCMDWAIGKEGTLGVGSTGRVCLWQVAELSKDDPRELHPLHSFEFGQKLSEAVVTGIKFSQNRDSQSSFACCTTEGDVFIQDMRTSCSTPIFSLAQAATCIDLSPHDDTSVLVGDEAGQVHFFDLRNRDKPVSVHSDPLHMGEVTALQWCPHSRHLFSSGAVDGTVAIYNLVRKKVLFRHAGHTERVMDIGWSWQEGFEGQMISCDANSITMWRPRDYFFIA